MQASDFSALDGEVKMETEAAVSRYVFLFHACAYTKKKFPAVLHTLNPLIYLCYIFIFVYYAQETDTEGQIPPSQVLCYLTGMVKHSIIFACV